MKYHKITIDKNKYDIYEYDNIMLMNLTNHPCTFVDTWKKQKEEKDIILPPSGLVVRGFLKEMTIIKNNHYEISEPKYIGDYSVSKILDSIKEKYPNIIFIGSYKTAIAFPGLVYSMIPVSGAGSIVLSDKKMNIRKFHSFKPIN